jgi:glycosyltransferase involved in cell wall biosynthesis
VLGCFGYLNEWKRLPELLAAFAELRRTSPAARLMLVGAASDYLGTLELGEGVLREDYVAEERLWSLLAACDAVVSLRSPTMGETSGTAIRAMALGKPLVVSGVGWFSELPDDVALKVPVGGSEAEAVARALALLADDPARRVAMGAAARELVDRKHDLERVAEAYAATLEEAAGGDAVRDAVLLEVARAAAETGIGADDPESAELARRLSEVGLGG